MHAFEYCLSSAGLSHCKTYRYWLRRIWSRKLPQCTFIGLNPSTADGASDDPTLRRCVNFAKSWGFGSLLLVNLFAMRATHPKMLRQAIDPIGPRNDLWLKRAVNESSIVIAAWGNGGDFCQRQSQVIPSLGKLHCLGTTAKGMPRHPLYCDRTCVPKIFKFP